MSNDAATESLLPVSTDLSPQFICNITTRKRRRYYNCGSTSSNENSTPEKYRNEFQAPPHSDSIFTAQFNFKQALIFLLSYLTIGAICFYLVRDQIKGYKTSGILDSIYFCIVTMTTVGYGDLVPDTVLAKLLACVFVLFGMALVGFILSKAADYIVEKEEVLFVKALHMRHKSVSNEINKDAEINKVKYKFLTTLILLMFLIIVGTVFLSQVEGLDFFDALYCVCVTITTLGYGDKSFSTKWGRIFAIFWILISSICLAQLFLYMAEMGTESRQRSLVHWVLTRKTTLADLEAADLDNDKVVSAAEFILYKLKEMGKISNEDVSIVMEEYRNLDIDRSGNLTASDLIPNQSSQS